MIGCSRGINDDNIAATFDKLRSEWACVVHSREVCILNWNLYTALHCIFLPLKVKAMVTGQDRRPHLGIKLALECRKKIIYPMKNKNSKFNNQPVNPDGTLVNKDGC